MRLHTLKSTLAALACLGMLAGPLLADDPDRLLSLPDAGRPLIHDVALDANTSLHGVVRDVNGKLQPNTEVSLWRGAVIVQRARTDQFGRFAFRGLRGSTYRIGTAATSVTCRAWTAATAPPGAQTTILLLSNTDSVRGQRPLSEAFIFNPLLMGALIAAAIAIPIALYNSDEDLPAGS